MKKLVISFILLSTVVANAKKNEPFEANVESLKLYECPEWFRDAKFGIWSCWNAYTVPGQGDWYARNMYLEGSSAYNYHCRTYGHPSKVGYKDVVDQWRGEKFNPKEQIKLFERAGAKYFVAMANHHDNFDLWDSKHQPWNSVNYGPKRNIIGEWYDAIQKSDLRWGITSHLERTWSWFQVAKQSDKKGAYQGVPYDGANPAYEQIYLPADENNDTSSTQPINAPEYWRKYWLNRCVDLIDKYHPDLFYVDGGVPFPGDDKGETGLKMISHLYNHSASRHKGENVAVMCLKNWYHVAPKGEWGYYWEGIGTLDFERTRSGEILPEPWQTDTYLGAWTWTPNIKYRSAGEIITELVDVISKNGNMLLNVSPRPDGTLDSEAIRILEQIGTWLKINGEAVYGTRPWIISGNYNFRVVKKGDDIYLSSLLKPSKELFIPFLAKPGESTKINNIKLLGDDSPISFRQGQSGLIIELPDVVKGEHVWVFKIEGENLCGYDVERFKAKPSGGVKDRINIWKDASHKDESPAELGAIAYDQYGNKWAVSKSGALTQYTGDNKKEFPYRVKDIDFTVSGFSGFVTDNGDLYFGKSEDWEKMTMVKNINRLSISEVGIIWAVGSDKSVWRIDPNGETELIKTFNTIDIACGDGDYVAIVDDANKIHFIHNRRAGWAIAADITRVDFSPKTGHLLAVYGGEIAIFKDKEWVFTGVRAKEVSSGKLNDDEIIGWVAE